MILCDNDVVSICGLFNHHKFRICMELHYTNTFSYGAHKDYLDQSLDVFSWLKKTNRLIEDEPTECRSLQSICYPDDNLVNWHHYWEWACMVLCSWGYGPCDQNKVNHCSDTHDDAIQRVRCTIISLSGIANFNDSIVPRPSQVQCWKRRNRYELSTPEFINSDITSWMGLDG